MTNNGCKKMNVFFSFLYQWFVFVPILILSTIVTAILVMVGCALGNKKKWGYVPPKYWSKLICLAALSKVSVRKSELIEPSKSYVFIANHQGAFDVFLVYGFLNQNIKWVQKHELRKIPFVGKASEIAGHVFVDNSSKKAMIRTIDKVEKELEDGASIVIFPEGARTEDGKMVRFKKGAYIIAEQMQLPMVPLTINGSYDILKIGSWRMKFLKKMELIVHDPVETKQLKEKDIVPLIEKTYDTIEADLWDKYKK